MEMTFWLPQARRRWRRWRGSDVGMPRERRGELLFTSFRKLQQGLIGIASAPRHGGKSRFGFAPL